MEKFPVFMSTFDLYYYDNELEVVDSSKHQFNLTMTEL